jgi:hypothetical protein
MLQIDSSGLEQVLMVLHKLFTKMLCAQSHLNEPKGVAVLQSCQIHSLIQH